MFPNRLENEIIAEAFTLQEREHERSRTEQVVNDMNRQIIMLTSLVITIVQRETSNPREGNDALATSSISTILSDRTICKKRMDPILDTLLD